MAFYQWKFSMGNGILPVEIFHGKWHFTNGNFNGNNGTLLLNAILPVEILHMGNDILPVEIFHRKWHFASGNFSWEIAFYQWKLLHSSFIWKIGLFLPPETYNFNFSSGTFGKIQDGCGDAKSWKMPNLHFLTLPCYKILAKLFFITKPTTWALFSSWNCIE